MCSLGKKDAELLKQLRKLHGDGSKLSATEAADAAAKADAKAGSAQSAAEKRAGALEGMRAYVARRGRVSFVCISFVRAFVRAFVHCFVRLFVVRSFVRSFVFWCRVRLCVLPPTARRRRDALPIGRTGGVLKPKHTRPISTTCLARRRPPPARYWAAPPLKQKDSAFKVRLGSSVFDEP